MGSAIPPNGWPNGFAGSSGGGGDRPKSAGIAGAPQPSSASGGLMTSLTGGGRPSSGGGSAGGGTQWGSQTGGSAGQQQGGQLQPAPANNALSYGSLKTRFLSGNNGKPTGVPQQGGGVVAVAPVSSAAPAMGAQAGNKPGSAKLFSLAR